MVSLHLKGYWAFEKINWYPWKPQQLALFRGIQRAYASFQPTESTVKPLVYPLKCEKGMMKRKQRKVTVVRHARRVTA